ncbi:MAG: hypothetical protein HDT28_08870 [Clostridiales bacterium]|nr:hypothetical protein [Clostridiales bacterium]
MKKRRQLSNKETKRGVLFWLKGHKAPKDDSRTDLETIVDDYIKCIKYLLNGKIVPITGFRDEVHEWLMTDSDGDIDLGFIPHDNGELTECRYEIEALIGDNGYDEDTILKALNEKIRTIS